MCRVGFVAGGFASVKQYYYPLKWYLEKEGFEISFLHPGPLGLNVWPLEVFLANARPVIEKAPDSIFLIGHSLGGIQSIYLADMYPKIKKVFAVGSPVWGCPMKMYEDSIRTMLAVPETEFRRFQEEIVPRNASRVVTVSCENDMLAPKTKCVIEGASNYVVEADEEGLSSSHLLLPYLSSTIKIIADETRAIDDQLAELHAGLVPTQP